MDSTDEPEKTILICQSLESALRHLRYADEARTLWIDALCIIQLDLEARSVQVRQVTDISKYAGRVIGWLGKPTSTPAHAFSTLVQLGTQVELGGNGARLPSPSSDTPLFNSVSELLYDGFTWRSLHELFKSPWFELRQLE